MLILREGLRARGHQVRLLTSDAMLVPGWPIEADATCRGSTGRAQPYLQTWNPWALAALKRELREFRPDVVHIRMFLWQLSPAILSVLEEVPTLYQAAVYKAICPTGLKLLPSGQPCEVRAGRACLTNRCVAPPTWASTMLQLSFVRRYWHAVDKVVALSSEMAAVLREGGLSEVEVVHNGIAERPMRPPLGAVPLLGYAGRLSREKGVDLLVEAFARALPRVPAARLLIAGSGPLEASLRRRIVELRIESSVDMLGYLDRETLESRFAGLWAQAAPSLWREPFGNVATEAMMRGTAVIASSSGGFVDIVEDECTGRLVTPGSLAELEQAVTGLLLDRAAAERMGRAGHERACRHFSNDAVIDAFESIYGTLQSTRSLQAVDE